MLSIHYGIKDTQNRESSAQAQVTGFDNIKYVIYKGLVLMAYKTHIGNVFTNSQELAIHSWTDDRFILLTQASIQIELDIKHTASFKPRYAMTVHKSQGSTFTKPYSIYEYKQMKANMLYVALTRARDRGQINFCEISNHTPYKGYLYSYERKGIYYVGSTRDLKKRQQEHMLGIKAGFTKLKKAFTEYGYNNFTFTVLETLRYNNIKELYELEDKYIDKYNSIENGYNMRWNKNNEF
jgi:predicted GIY-YIG superfamily endonuclease